MRGRIRAAALLAVLFCASCVGGPRHAQSPVDAEATDYHPPTTSHAFTATRVWNIVGRPFGVGILGRSTHASALTVTKSGTPHSLVVIFPLAPTRVDCIQLVTIKLQVSSLRGTPELNAYPAADFAAAANNLRAVSTNVITVESKAMSGPVTRGTVILDATDLYTSWIGGYPEQTGTGHRLVPGGTPLVTVLRRPDETDGEWSVTLAGLPTVTYAVRDDCPSPQQQGELTPRAGVASEDPVARARPTAADAMRALGRPVDVAAYRAQVDLGHDTPYSDYVWGDVENYQGGQAYFDDDAVVLRLVTLVDRERRLFSVVAFDVATGLHSPVSQNGGGSRPPTWTWDDPRTPWAD